MKVFSPPANLLLFLISILISSCDLFVIHDTNVVNLDGLNELKGTILPEGQSASETMAPFIYRRWFGYSSAQQPIDSLYFLKNRSGELSAEYAIKKLISCNKRNQRSEYLLSNEKYFYVECDNEANFFVSEFVNSASELQKPLKRGKYISIASKPDNW